MLSFQWQAVEIDRCPRCNGVWLDAGEMETLLELAGLPSGPLSAALAAAPDGVRGKRRCPSCPHRLREIRLRTTPEIVLDRCRLGHGLWFDQGEVSQLVRSFTVGEEGLVASFLGDLFRDDAAAAAGR
jgi:Zn-finger nucleic acid-binding protein